MAITSITLDPASSEGGWDMLWRRTYRRTYLVETDSRHDNEVTLRTQVDGSGTPLLPRIGYPFREYNAWTSGSVSTTAVIDAGAFVQGVGYKAVKRGANPEGSQWNVSYDYGPYDATVFPQNPIDWPTKLQFTSNHYDRVIWFDQNGDAVVNSAGDRYAEPITIDDNRSVITLTRNVLCSVFDPTLAESYRDTVNNALWNGFATHTVKCASITTSETQYDSNAQVYYFTLTFVFEINRDTWAREIVDMGYVQVVAGKRVKILDSQGQPVADPALLNGSGAVLAVGGTPVTKTYDVFPEKDFSVFDIDFTLCLGR